MIRAIRFKKEKYSVFGILFVTESTTCGIVT